MRYLTLLFACFCGTYVTAPGAWGQGAQKPDDHPMAFHDVLWLDSASHPEMKPGQGLSDANLDGAVDWIGTSDNGLSFFLGGAQIELGTRQKMSAFNLGPNSNLQTHLRPQILLQVGNQIGVAQISMAFDTFPFPPFRVVPYIVIWDAASGEALGASFMPEAAPGLPSAAGFGEAIPYGDLDGDGYEEILITFYQDSALHDAFISGLFDTSTMRFRWIDYAPTQYQQIIPAMNSGVTKPGADVNGDGIKDVFIVYVDNNSGLRDWRARCLDGRTGNVIWSRTWPLDSVPTPIFTAAATLTSDLDNDGITDIILGAPHSANHATEGKIQLISGGNGSLIWEVPFASLDPRFVPNQAQGIDARLPIRSFVDIDNDGWTDFIFQAIGPERYSLVAFSGKNGSRLTDYSWDAGRTDPWTSTLGLFPRPSSNQYVGDVDGDGYPEWYARISSISEPVPGLAIVGFKTLHHPESASIGSTIRLGLDIPSGPNRPFRVLLSTDFAEDESGLHFGAWDTHLLPSPVLWATQGQAGLRGVLDATGKADIQFRIPLAPNLVGENLYAVALVEDASGQDGILTRSTIAMIDVR